MVVSGRYCADVAKTDGFIIHMAVVCGPMCRAVTSSSLHTLLNFAGQRRGAGPCSSAGVATRAQPAERHRRAAGGSADGGVARAAWRSSARGTREQRP